MKKIIPPIPPPHHSPSPPMGERVGVRGKCWRLKTAAGSETVYRYAPIYKIEIAGLTDLPFGEYEGGLIVNGGAWTSGFAQVTLTIERGEWSDKIPEEYTNIVNAVNVTNGLFTPTNDISHVYRYDASSDTFSSNLIGASLPYDLFTNPSGTGDRLYIGSASQFYQSCV